MATVERRQLALAMWVGFLTLLQCYCKYNYKTLAFLKLQYKCVNGKAAANQLTLPVDINSVHGQRVAKRVCCTIAKNTSI